MHVDDGGRSAWCHLRDPTTNEVREQGRSERPRHTPIAPSHS